MTDVVVTVPKGLWLDWIDEGDLPGESYDGTNEYHFFGRGPVPDIKPGERVYVVAHGLLRGYAPLVRIDTPNSVVRAARNTPYTNPDWPANPRLPDWWWPGATYGLVRHGGAVAATIPRPIRGFRGWMYRDWEREEEVPFPDWKTRGVVI